MNGEVHPDISELMTKLLLPDVKNHRQESEKSDKDSFILEMALNSELDFPAPGGYNLFIAGRNIGIASNCPEGLHSGFISLRLLFEANRNQYDEIILQETEITDYPRFPYRGMHLDCARHFFTIEEVKKYIDLLSIHKMNYFHWHLVDDQGWRIQSDKYPRLNEISSWRKEKDGSTYGGFYTKDEMKEAVRYAQERYITIVPEVEMPGHCLSVLAAYPEFSCAGGPFEVTNIWGIFEDVYCPGKEKVFAFIEGIMEEVSEIFPGPYVHIGGDECLTDRWKQCPDCRKLMKSEGFTDETQLQMYFIKRAQKILARLGKKMIGWDEILEGGKLTDATITAWRSFERGADAAEAGVEAIMCPTSHCYFDYYQGAPESEPKAIGGFLPLEKVYQFDPCAGLPDKNLHKYIIGGQGNVWTEYMPDFAQVEYMTVPRICALAEKLWTPAEKCDFDDFLKRLGSHLDYIRNAGHNFRPEK